MNFFANKLRELAAQMNGVTAATLNGAAMEIESLERRLTEANADLNALDGEIELAVDAFEEGWPEFDENEVISLAPAFDPEPCIVV